MDVLQTKMLVCRVGYSEESGDQYEVHFGFMLPTNRFLELVTVDTLYNLQFNDGVDLFK